MRLANWNRADVSSECDGSAVDRRAPSVPLDAEEVAADVPQPPSGFITAALRSHGGWSAVTEEKQSNSFTPIAQTKLLPLLTVHELLAPF